MNKLSDTGQQMIKSVEGLRLKAYKATPEEKGWTIGYGSTRIDNRPVQENEIITREKAQDLFNTDIKIYESVVNNLVKVPLTQNQFDALVVFVYNIGGPQFSTSTLLRKLNKKDYNGAQKEFVKWNKQNGKVIRGLTIRRQKEADLFGVIKKKSNKKKLVDEKISDEWKDLLDGNVKEDIVT